MLKIILDGTPISPKSSGVGFYVANLIYNLYSLQLQEQFQLDIAYQPGLKSWLLGQLELPDFLKEYRDRLIYLPLPVKISDFLIDKFPELFSKSLPYYSPCPDIIHGTNYTVFPYKNCSKVMTIYDVTFIKYPDFIDSVVKEYSTRVRKCLEWTDLIITISESSKKDIIEYLKIDEEKIRVIPIASRFHPDYLLEKDLEKLKSSLEQYFSQPYILFVSTIEPRKNINTLITAFNYLKGKSKIPHNLILVGRKGWLYQPIFNAIENSPWKSYIHHLDYLSDELVALLYSQADVFVYPSHYEGFGLPVLEAMTFGTPVVTSNTSSLPEVTGDAAILIDPQEPMQIADAILKIISDSQLRQELIQKGKQRAKLFSWERTAKETLKAYYSIKQR